MAVAEIPDDGWLSPHSLAVVEGDAAPPDSECARLISTMPGRAGRS